MHGMGKALYVLLAGLAALSAGQAAAQSRADKLIATDRLFARYAGTTSAKTAYLAFMDDSARVVSQGRLAPGKAVWERKPETDKLLTWAPAYADASAGADLGFTQGQWRLAQGTKLLGTGIYTTVWRRQADGNYKLLLDLGTENADTANLASLIAERALMAGKPDKTSSAQKLLELERTFGKKAGKNTAQAYEDFLSLEARLCRPGQTALTTPTLIRSFLLVEPAYKFEPEGTRLAQSGDMGYVFGTYTTTKGANASGVYLHVWKNEASGWRLVLEVLDRAQRRE